MTKTTTICVRIPTTMNQAILELVKRRLYKSRSHFAGAALRRELITRKLKLAARQQIELEQPTQRRRHAPL